MYITRWNELWSTLGAVHADETLFCSIREEYSWVPQLVFDFKRRSILREFLRRNSVFRTAHFAKRFEQQARDNLERSVGRR